MNNTQTRKEIYDIVKSLSPSAQQEQKFIQNINTSNAESVLDVMDELQNTTIFALSNTNRNTIITLWNYAMMETGQLNFIHSYHYHPMSRLNEFKHLRYEEDCEVWTAKLHNEKPNEDWVQDQDYFLTNYGQHEGQGIYQYKRTNDVADVNNIDNIVKIDKFIYEDTSAKQILKMIDSDFLLGFMAYKNITTSDLQNPQFEETITAHYEQACLDNAIKWHYNEESPECTRTTNDVVIHFNPHEVGDVSTDISETSISLTGDNTDSVLCRDNLTGQIEGDAIIELRVVREGLDNYEMAYMISVPFTGNIVKGWSQTSLDEKSDLKDIVNNNNGHAIEAIKIADVTFDLNQIKNIKKANVQYADGGITYSEEDGLHFVTGTNRNEDVKYIGKAQALNESELNSINQFIELIKKADPLHLTCNATFMTINNMIDHPMLGRINTLRCLKQVSQQVQAIEQDVVLKQTNKMSYSPTN